MHLNECDVLLCYVLLVVDSWFHGTCCHLHLHILVPCIWIKENDQNQTTSTYNQNTYTIAYLHPCDQNMFFFSFLIPHSSNLHKITKTREPGDPKVEPMHGHSHRHHQHTTLIFSFSMFRFPPSLHTPTVIPSLDLIHSNPNHQFPSLPTFIFSPCIFYLHFWFIHIFIVHLHKSQRKTRTTSTSQHHSILQTEHTSKQLESHPFDH